MHGRDVGCLHLPQRQHGAVRKLELLDHRGEGVARGHSGELHLSNGAIANSFHHINNTRSVNL